MTSSCRLFHGPGARQAAIAAAYKLGRLLHEPFGDAGLKVDEAREFVALTRSPPVGTEDGVVLAGPVDHAAPKSSDVLLKTIEEPPPHVHPLLWATDLGGVSPTIQSRCLPVWCPASGTASGDEEVEDVARTLVNEVLAERYWQVPLLVAKVKSTPKQRGREPELVAEILEAFAAQMDNPKVLKLWPRLRELACWSNPTQIEIIAALLPGEP